MNKYEKIVKKVSKNCLDPKVRVSPLVAIRAKCLDCMCYQANEVRLCSSDDCPLWRFRFGRNLSAPRGGGKSVSKGVKFASGTDTEASKNSKV